MPRVDLATAYDGGLLASASLELANTNPDEPCEARRQAPPCWAMCGAQDPSAIGKETSLKPECIHLYTCTYIHRCSTYMMYACIYDL